MSTKKELKDQYRQTKFPMGVFQIRNTVNDRAWLEGSVNMPALWNRLRFQLDLGAHPNADFQADWKALGAAAFVYEVVSQLEHEETDTPRNWREEVETLLMLCLEDLKSSGKPLYF